MTSFLSSAISSLNRLTHRMGHILSLSISLALWFAIFAVLVDTSSGEQDVSPLAILTTTLESQPIESDNINQVSAVDSKYRNHNDADLTILTGI